MIWDVILFVVGFYILVKGASFLIDGVSSFAKNLGISNFVIGLVVVGIGTSIPEFAITFLSNLTSGGDVGIGTVVGSNTFNILFILGFSAMFFPLQFKEQWVRRDLLWNILAIIVTIVFVLFFGDWSIGRLEGLVMLVLFAFWIYISIKKPAPEEEKPLRTFAFPIAAIMIFAGFLGVFLGAKWVIDGAETMARAIGISETIIGLTVVGIGTSLPEFAVSFAAALRGEPGIAIGNIIGSNVFDFLMILGASAVAKPIVFSPEILPDIAITMLSAVLLYVFVRWRKAFVLERWQGGVLVLGYIFYFLYILARI